ncbi:hypothetical protein EDD86DRAFT_77090 [Gorgonomyces haynaldii]|nr:hypothetical protein EDD86DRAFT_77090 [Gorgonomyces haynaldii]
MAHSQCISLFLVSCNFSWFPGCSTPPLWSLSCLSCVFVQPVALHRSGQHVFALPLPSLAPRCARLQLGPGVLPVVLSQRAMAMEWLGLARSPWFLEYPQLQTAIDLAEQEVLGPCYPMPVLEQLGRLIILGRFLRTPAAWTTVAGSWTPTTASTWTSTAAGSRTLVTGCPKEQVQAHLGHLHGIRRISTVNCDRLLGFYHRHISLLYLTFSSISQIPGSVLLGIGCWVNVNLLDISYWSSINLERSRSDRYLEGSRASYRWSMSIEETATTVSALGPTMARAYAKHVPQVRVRRVGNT